MMVVEAVMVVHLERSHFTLALPHHPSVLPTFLGRQRAHKITCFACPNLMGHQVT